MQRASIKTFYFKKVFHYYSILLLLLCQLEDIKFFRYLNIYIYTNTFIYVYVCLQMKNIMYSGNSFLTFLEKLFLNDSYYIVISRTLLGIIFFISCLQRKNLYVVWEKICFVIKLSFRAESIFVQTIRIARIKRISRLNLYLKASSESILRNAP